MIENKIISSNHISFSIPVKLKIMEKNWKLFKQKQQDTSQVNWMYIENLHGKMGLETQYHHLWGANVRDYMNAEKNNRLDEEENAVDRRVCTGQKARTVSAGIREDSMGWKGYEESNWRAGCTPLCNSRWTVGEITNCSLDGLRTHSNRIQ